MAERLWTRVLTPAERERLGGDLEEAYHRYVGAAGMWRKLHGVSIPQAVLGVGTALRLVDPAVANALLREFGEALTIRPRHSTGPSRPADSF